jgi:hypothetical protein
MTDELRSLLTDVAEGRVDPSEAAARLSRMDATGPAAAPADPWAEATGAASGATGPGDAGAGAAEAAPAQPPGTATAAAASHQLPPAESSDQPVSRVVVHSSARPVRVVADPTVASFTVEGPHSVRRDGATARVEVPVAGTPDEPGSYRYERKTGLARWIGQATFVGVPLTVRMNPELALEVEVMAGSVDLGGLRGDVEFSVTAGSIKATDCAGPFNGTVRAGSAKLELRPSAGASRLRVESGSVDLRLQPGSDAKVRAHAELGEVKVRGRDGSSTRVVDREGTYEVVVGSGTATVDLDVVMGSVKVTTP